MLLLVRCRVEDAVARDRNRRPSSCSLKEQLDSTSEIFMGNHLERCLGPEELVSVWEVAENLPEPTLRRDIEHEPCQGLAPHVAPFECSPEIRWSIDGEVATDPRCPGFLERCAIRCQPFQHG